MEIIWFACPWLIRRFLLSRLGTIMRAADRARLDPAPQAARLLADSFQQFEVGMALHYAFRR